MFRKTICFLSTRHVTQAQRICSLRYSRNMNATAVASTKSWIKNNDSEMKEYFEKDDPDMFGTLSKGAKQLTVDDKADEGDLKEEKFLSEPPRKSKRLSTKVYSDIIKAYIRKRQIKEAIDVVEVRMLEEDRVKPNAYIFNLLLGACGRVGYTKKAFKLFNDMKKRGLKATGGTYTALFNACSNSPWSEDGLSRARKLRELMIEQRVIPNDTNYNAMIKAFGRCGDIQTAFSLVDEMIENKINVTQDTINFLLQSCISDKDAGFRHAILVWRKFHQKNIKPDIYSFNLMLRCIRDCGIGDVESMNLLLASASFDCLSSRNREPTLQIESTKSSPTESSLVENEATNELYNWPNLLAPTPYLGNIIELKNVTKPEHRLLLVGGFSGLLRTMQEAEVKPDIKTFTQLMDCIPSTLAAEQVLLSAMKKRNLKSDIDFLNMLIKKRSMRFDYENAKAVLSMFKRGHFRPNIITYGVLALGCQTEEEAQSLLEEMEDSGYRINIEILGAMLKQGCVHFNFPYIEKILKIVAEENIKPNKIFMEHLEEFHKRCKRQLKESKDKSFSNSYRAYRMQQKKWAEGIEIDTSEEVHPWEQFRKPTETNVKNYKDKETHFKPRITSRFRQKTGPLNK